MKHNRLVFSRSAPLFIIILIDAMSFAMMAPVLAVALVSPSTAVLMQHQPIETRQFTFGLAIAICPLIVLFTAPLLGRLSDQIGRRNVLAICSAGLLLGNFLVGASMAISSLAVLFVGRVIQGATSASQATAQAAVIDMSEPDSKAFNLSMTLLFSSVGFILGPALGGFLSNHSLSPLFNFPLPFYALAVLSGINMVFLLIFYQDTKQAAPLPKGSGFDFVGGIKDLFLVFRDKKLKWISLSFLLMQMGWGCFFSFVTVFLIDRHQFSPHDVASFMSILGIGFCISYGIIVPFMTRFLKIEQICSVGLLLTGIEILIFTFVQEKSLLWIFPLPISITVCFAYGTIITLFSNSAGEDRQGWIMGTTTSIVAMAWFASSFIASFIETCSMNGNMLFTVLLMMGSLLFFGCTGKTCENKKETLLQKEAVL